MFLDELRPIVQEITKQPIAFMGGFFSGLLRLNPSEEPLKSWLQQQGGFSPTPSDSDRGGNNGNGPQSISID